MAILYPPIVDTYMPAFVENCTINFFIPSLNSEAEISNAMVISIVDQRTNKSILPKEILFCQRVDSTTVTINSIFLKGLNINNYYKVQLKFIQQNSDADRSAMAILNNNIGAEPPEEDRNWLAKYNNQCSEWSTVCLIRKISAPNITMVGIPENASTEPLIWADSNGIFSGRLTFNNKEETELLKSFRITASLLNETVIDSGEQYTSGNINPNEFQYISNYLFQDGEIYTLKIKCVTQNNYVITKTFYFIIKYNEELGAVLPNSTQIYVEGEQETGRVKVTVSGGYEIGYVGNFVIRRASSKSDFNYWEDVHFGSNADGTAFNYNWYDYCVENGTIYKYCVQGVVESEGLLKRGPAFLSNSCLVYFESTYLVANGLQLDIKYNTQISSLSKIVQETKIETIGSKYPFIRKNGQVGYKEFSLSGLITFHMDEPEDFFSIISDSLLEKEEEEEVNSTGNTFSSKAQTLDFSQNKEIRKIEQEAFESYQKTYNITKYNDLIYEKKFRDKVLNFLQDNQIKLFKSATEGNLLVKLININLSPMQTVGRYLYNFSCTATEIDDFNLLNCDKYNIQTIGKYQHMDFQSEKVAFFGQYEGVMRQKKLSTIVDEKYKYQNKDTNLQNNFCYFNYVQVQFNDPPKLLEVNGIQALGYSLIINGQSIHVDTNGFFELSGKDVKITSLLCPNNQKVTINYNAIFETGINKNKKLLSSQSFPGGVGQLMGSFKYKDTLQKYLKEKYYYDNEERYQKLNSIYSIVIEAAPGSVFYVNDFNDTIDGKSYFNRHIIGPTGVLNFYSETRDIQKGQPIINDFYFAGLHFTKLNETQKDRAPSVNGYIDYNEYTGNSHYFLSTDEIVNPIFNAVYCIGTESDFHRYIYYNYKWYLIDDNDDIEIDTEAMINYICIKEKGVYQKI